MVEGFEEKFVKPIVNASYPGTLAALSLTAIQAGGEKLSLTLRYVLLATSMMFLLSAFFIFFYSIYPTQKKIWTCTAVTFLLGLCFSVLAVFLLFIL